jgi:TonB-linked SusC/RagA family outer membrane protein
MRVRLSAVIMALGLLIPLPIAAQQPTRVVGQVQDNGGKPLAGVQVFVIGTTVGTLTDGNGQFSLEVPARRDSLSFTYIGYRTAVRAVAAVVNVTLRVEAVSLEGLVVTALGIEREQRTIPYAAQTVSGDRLNQVPTTNVVAALQGNIAGLHVTNSSAPFGSARIVVRGASSILGENQPLIIVDGIPIDNSAASLNGYGGGSMEGYNVGNAAADIDANNIESVTVLKGPNAAALYGSRAANGAIVYTTKKGRGPEGQTGFGLSATIGSQFETPLMLPSYQNQYGQGFTGEFEFVDGNGGGVNDFADESWGPKLDGRTTGCVYNAAGTAYDTSRPCRQFFGEGPWQAHPDNVRNFWETGALTTLNVAVSRSAERSNVRLSVGRQDESGMYPNNRNIRTDVALAGGAQISDRLSTEAAIDYITNGYKNQPKQSYDDTDPMQNFIWFGRQVDIDMLKQTKYRNPSDPLTQDILAGNGWIRTDAPIPYSWNYSYHDNPYWMAGIKTTDFDRNRLLGHASATYRLLDWMSVTGRVGRDWYENSFRSNYPVNTVDGGYRLGSLYDRGETRSQMVADFLLTANRPLMQDLNVTVNAGGAIAKNDFNSRTGEVSELVIPGVYTLENSAGQPATSIYQSEKQVNSLYGSASFNWKNWFSVDVTGRNDWSSTLPRDNNSYFYPSVGAAFIFTDALGIQSNILSYGKLRASWTRVGNDTDPYQLEAVYGSGTPWAGQPTFTVDNALPNPVLKPEQTIGIELGTDLGLLNNRLILTASVFEKKTKDQILPVSISNATGFLSAWVNSGEVRNRGVELQVNATPVQMADFRWNTIVNWAKVDNKVLSLYSGVDRIVIGTYWNASITADVGEPYGNIVGTKWKRNEQGQIIVNDDGLPVRDSRQVVLGNYNPDWHGGISNTLSYRDVSLSFSFDGQWGGQVYSVTKWFGSYAGVLERTLAGREEEWNKPGYLVPNSVYDSSAAHPRHGEPNTTHVLAEDYWHNIFYAQEEGLVDASYLKLRDARIAWNLPDRFVRRMGFSGATFALVGHNLLLWTKQDIIDPETAFDASNRQGVENAQLPTTRSFGFTFTVKP